jgi:hypothetical protein
MVCGMALPLSSDETYTVGSKIDWKKQWRWIKSK